MENVDKQLQRSTGIVLDHIGEMADMIDAAEYDYNKDETEEYIRQIDAAVQYLKQAMVLRRLDGVDLTRYPERITDGTPRPVICIETGKVYGSISEAAEDTGVNSGNISSAVRGILSSAGGLHWMAYIEERPAPPKKFQKPVICVETGEIFQSMKEAGQKTGVSGNNISSVIRGKVKTAGGYHWELYVEPEKEETPNTDRKVGTLKLQPRRKSSKAVVCMETGVEYESAAEAERQTGIKRTSITQCTNGKQQVAGGYHWAKASDLEVD